MKIKTQKEIYQENENTPNEEREWFGKICVKCKRKITKSPISVNIYNSIGVDGYECGRKDCRTVKGSEYHKKLFWQLELLQLILNPGYWGYGVAERGWKELQEFADDNDNFIPRTKDKMRKFPLIDIIRFLRIISK